MYLRDKVPFGREYKIEIQEDPDAVQIRMLDEQTEVLEVAVMGGPFEGWCSIAWVSRHRLLRKMGKCTAKAL